MAGSRERDNESRGKRVDGGSRFAYLYGSAQDFAADQLATLYPTQKAFLAAYDKALQKSIEEGMVLAKDAPKLRKAAQAWSSQLE